MRKFDTKVQHLKYKVLREVARLAWNDKLLDNIISSLDDVFSARQTIFICISPYKDFCNIH